jgi:hypothetical protein
MFLSPAFPQLSFKSFQYLQHSQCAVYIAKQLFEQQKLNTEILASIYDNSWETSANEEQAASQLIPGASLYMFSESVPVFITLRWFLQCVVLAKNSAEGGLQARFLAQLNQNELIEDALQCENYAIGNKNHNIRENWWDLVADWACVWKLCCDGRGAGKTPPPLQLITHRVNEVRV